MGGGSKKQVKGYRYTLGLHLVLIHGQADFLKRIQFDKTRTAWEGSIASGSATVSAEDLYGGDQKEGGVSGVVDFLPGSFTQLENAYLQTQFGTDIPAFRGVASLVFHGPTADKAFYFGMNPYLKIVNARLQRILITTDGAEQWYAEKAAIRIGEVIIPATYDEGLPVEIDWYQATYEQGTNDQATMGVGFYTPAGVLIGSITYATLLSPPTTPPHNNWVARSVGDSTPADCGRIRLFMKMHRRTGEHNNGYIDDIEATLDGVPLAIVNPGAEAGIFGWTKVVGNLGRINSTAEAHSGAYWFDGANSLDTVYYQEFTPPALEGTFDMNPAHIIREALTSPDWGMGYNEVDIDDTSFTLAADILYSEALGISLLWDKQMPLEEFIDEIKRHINGTVYVSRATGKFVLKLIRADYNVDDLLVLDVSNTTKVEGYNFPAFGENVNSITVIYWDSATNTPASWTEDDTALIQMQGVAINTTVQYPGFTNLTIAKIIALRDLQTLSTPLRTCTIYCNTEARDLNIGDAFVLNWPDYSPLPLVLRVMGMTLGDGKTNQIKVIGTQDQFAMPAANTVSDPETEPGWSDPSQPPEPAALQIAIEAPYYELIQRAGQSSVDDTLRSANDAGYVLAAAVRASNELNAKVYLDAGSGYELADSLDFSPTATLSAGVSRTATTFPITPGKDYGRLNAATHAQIDDELFSISAFDSTTLTVGRGVLDTVPAAHLLGADIIFWDEFGEIVQTQFANGETIDVKILPSSGKGTLDIGDATPVSVTMAQRAWRPYPPGLLKINGHADPTAESENLVFTWAHRDRGLQSDVLYDTTQPSVGPEQNVTYHLRIIKNSDNSVVLEASNLGGTTTSVILPIDYAGIRAEFWSDRDGFESFQRHVLGPFVYTAGAAGAAFAAANPGSPGANTGTTADPPEPVLNTLEDVYDSATAIIPIVSQIFGK